MENRNYFKERGKYRRLLMDLPLKYQMTDLPHAHGGLSVNVSETGLLIHSIKDMPVGIKINMAVLFSKGYELETSKCSQRSFGKISFSRRPGNDMNMC